MGQYPRPGLRGPFLEEKEPSLSLTCLIILRHLINGQASRHPIVTGLMNYAHAFEDE